MTGAGVMTLEVRTVIYLRERKEALQQLQPITLAAREALLGAIEELDVCIQKIVQAQRQRRWEA